MKTENTVVPGPGGVVAPLVGGLEGSAQEDRRVFELLGDRRLDVEVVAELGAQRVVLPGPRVEGRSGALDPRPVEHVPSALLLSPAAQVMLKVTLQLRSCGTSQQKNEFQQGQKTKATTHYTEYLIELPWQYTPISHHTETGDWFNAAK